MKKKMSQKNKKNQMEKTKKINLRETLTLENIKLFCTKLLNNTKCLFLDNKIVLLYLIGATLNGVLLRSFTIGKPFAFRPILADLIVSLIFVSLYFLVKKKHIT